MRPTGGRIGRAVTAVAAGLLLLVPAFDRPAPAGASTTFEAIAAADGIRFSVRNPNAPVTDTPVDGGGPTAQAVLNTSGVSRAFASHPYPGEAVVTGPGTVAGFTGGQLNPPAYPFAVASDYPTVPERTIDQGPYRIKATSAERHSESEAHAGSSPGPVVDARARAVAQDSGGALAEGISDVAGFAAGEVRIARVLSTATVVSAPDGTITRSSDLQITGFTVAGTAVALGPAGLTLPGNAVPLPATDPLRQALAGAGITVTYLSAAQQPTGVIAPGVAVTAPVALPGGGHATLLYRLGQSSASIGAVTLPGSGDLGSAPPAGIDPGGDTGGSGGSGDGAPSSVTGPGPTGSGSGDTGGLPSGNGSGGVGGSGVGRGGAFGSECGSGGVGGSGAVSGGALGSLPGSECGAGGTSGAGAGGAAGMAAGGAASAPRGSGSEVLASPVFRTRGFDSASIFLVLAAAGLIAFGLVTLFSAVGVRRRWTF